MGDWLRGEVELCNDLKIRPGFTFEDFKKTKEYQGQDGIRVIELADAVTIDNHKYYVSFFFREGNIYALSLFCCDQEFGFEDEIKRKELHDRILAEYNITEENYPWGKIVSNYDRRGNVSSIGFYYIQ